MPDVKIHDVHNLQVKSSQQIDKDGVAHEVTRLSFEADIPPANVARILNFRRQRGRPIDIIVESPQAEFDLTLGMVNVQTGELGGEDR